MADFLEETVYGVIRYGSSWQDKFAVNVVQTSGGSEYRSLVHPFPVRSFDVSYMLDEASLWANLMNLYARAHGRYAGFRCRANDEYSSKDMKGTPSAFDQPTIVLAATTRQLVKQYGTDKAAGTSGYPYRVIKKPAAGTVKVAKNGVELSGGSFSVDTTTGIVTVSGALITDTITAGFLFDFPVRFDTDLPIGMDYPGYRIVDECALVELLNP